MPRRAKSPCAQPGCPALVESGRSYCPEHGGDRGRGSSAQRGYGGRWQRLRAAYLAGHPVCVDPFGRHEGQVIPATEVDHITPRVRGGTDHVENLQALCKSCHSYKTSREQGEAYPTRG